MKRLFLISLGVLLIATGCNKEEPVPITDLVSNVTTSQSEDITVKFRSATLRGTVKYKGDGKGVTCGFTFHAENGEEKEITATPSGDGQLEIEVTNLNPGEKYYYKAFAKNAKNEKLEGKMYNFITFPESPVDLGLPSGLKWSACNVDAELPTDSGGYYAWGEVETKSYYDWYTYKYCKDGDGTKGITKYISERDSYLKGDGKRTLEESDDVAHVKMGGNWRMPTSAEVTELIQNCKITDETINNVRGKKYISKKTMAENVFIFIPSAGKMHEGVITQNIQEVWTSSLYSGLSSSKAYSLLSSQINETERKLGLPVRAVCK